MSFSQAGFLETSLSQKTAPAHEEEIRLLGETVRRGEGRGGGCERVGWVCCALGGEPVSESEVSSPTSLRDSGGQGFSAHLH